MTVGRVREPIITPVSFFSYAPEAWGEYRLAAEPGVSGSGDSADGSHDVRL